MGAAGWMAFVRSEQLGRSASADGGQTADIARPPPSVVAALPRFEGSSFGGSDMSDRSLSLSTVGFDPSGESRGARTAEEAKAPRGETAPGETAQSEAARPETALPETARPETARTETVRSETAEPETAELLDASARFEEARRASLADGYARFEAGIDERVFTSLLLSPHNNVVGPPVLGAADPDRA